MRKAHDTYVDEIISGGITNNLKRLWTYLKSKKQDTNGLAPLKAALDLFKVTKRPRLNY